MRTIRSERFNVALYVSTVLKLIAGLIVVGGIFTTVEEARQVDGATRVAFISGALVASLFAAGLLATAGYVLEVLIEIWAELWEQRNLTSETVSARSAGSLWGRKTIKAGPVHPLQERDHRKHRHQAGAAQPQEQRAGPAVRQPRHGFRWSK